MSAGPPSFGNREKKGCQRPEAGLVTRYAERSIRLWIRLADLQVDARHRRLKDKER